MFHFIERTFGECITREFTLVWLIRTIAELETAVRRVAAGSDALAAMYALRIAMTESAATMIQSRQRFSALWHPE